MHEHRSRIVVASVLVLAGCQTYAPRPLDPDAHRAAWLARWPARAQEAGPIRDLIARLDSDLTGAAGELDPSDGLTLREGRLVALAFHPELRLARLRAGRAAASAEHAGLWADPQLALDVLRITESVPDPWVITPSLSFSIPLSGRLDAERDRADAAQRAAALGAREAEWSVWHEVGQRWVAWSAARVRTEETARLVEAMDGLVDTASQLAESGELARTEAALFALEQAYRRNQLRRLEGEARAAEQELKAGLGLAPGAPVTFVPSFDAGSASEAAPAQLAERNPTLARLRAEYAVAEESLRREIAAQVPDLTLGPLAESDAGQSRIGFTGALPLPFLNANRRAIAEAHVDRELARAAFETGYETLVGRRAAAAARAAALEAQRADLEAVLVPLVERQLADALELMRLGEGTSLVLFESLTRAHRTKLELVEIRSAEALARAEVQFLTGPPAAVAPVQETP